ncbi:MAG TPA: kelch repeat-containing protein [Bryobacteraceae bacterium]|nr:kelch repeat-containing protein [Bryobacteraceae bacterium]
MFQTRMLKVLFAAAAVAAFSSAYQPGTVEVLEVDNFHDGTNRTRLFQRTPEGTVELRENSADHATLTALVREAHGAVLRPEAPAGTCSATGQQNAAIILVSFPSKALLSSVTPALVRSSFFGAGRTVDTFLRESSFGKTSITGSVFGPYVLDADYFDQPLAVRDAAVRAVSPHTNLKQYNRIIVVAPQGQTGMDSGGMALLGCGQIASPQGELNASSIWMGAESMVAAKTIVDIATHELGHAFGLEHARFADYGVDVLGPAGQAPAPWDAVHEYGDSFSSMGRNSAQWAAPHKALLGWLSSGTNYKNVTAAGHFTLSPYEKTGSNQVVRVSRNGAAGSDWLWLEYRQHQGTFDSTLPSAGVAGLLAHYTDPALTATLEGLDPATYANLVNFHPSTFANDPELHPGETWKDPYGTLSLTVSSANASGLTVVVSYAAAPVCPASVGAAQAFSASGGTSAVPVTAPASCSWTTSASVPWISVTSSGSGSGNGSVTFTVGQNNSMAPRWGKITVGKAFVIVTEAGASGSWMTLSPETGALPAAGGTGQIQVATNAPDLSWTMGTDAAWITDVECSCFLDVGPATIRYVVAVNTGQARTGHINIGSQTFTVNQAGNAAPSTVTFTQLSPPDAPPARLEQAMAPFGHTGQAILYGGAWDGNFNAVTWLWNESNWTALNPANNPGLVAQEAMVYDEARGNIVLFGGISGTTFAATNETWIWDGNNWTQMHPGTSPPARWGHAMAYDAVLGKTVLFGGYGDFGDMNDTWTWDGTNWAQVATTVSPLPRDGHAMTFDAAHSQIVLFGGMLSTGTLTWYGDTWLFDSKGWHQALTPTPPAARFGHLLAYHPALKSVVMIGGYGGKDVTANTWNYDFLRETWLWNGKEWTQQFPAIQPGPAYTITAAYDDTKNALTVHVGDDLTCISRGPKTYLLTAATTQ